MQLPSCLRRAAAILVTSLLLTGLAQREAQARTEDANVISVVSLATTTVESPPSAIRGNLLRANDGNLYAVASAGGSASRGAIARIAPDGTMTILHAMQSNEEGVNAYAGVIQANDGNLYGTTYVGGDKGGGVVFRVTLAGEYSVLRNLGQTKLDGFLPYTGVVQAADGNLYGTTLRGGTNDKGTIFRLSLSGDFTLVHSFSGTDGENPEGALIVGADGNLYGTTLQGGNGSRGTIYRLTPAGAVTTVYSFPSLSAFNDAGLAINATGANPRAALLLAADGNYYGTAYQGGTNGYGTVFRMTPAGAVTVVHAFTGPLTGASFPLSNVTQDAAGNLYGTTEQGGGINQGTAWRISPSGQFSLLHGFTASVNDGSKPYASLLVEGNDLYGVTSSDALFGAGGIIKLDLGSGGTLPVELAVSPTDLTVGGTATITWSSPSATSCGTSGAWSDVVGTSGTLAVTPADAGIYTYALTCTDAASVVRTAYASLPVRAPPAQTVDGGSGGGALSIPVLLLLGALALRKKS